MAEKLMSACIRARATYQPKRNEVLGERGGEEEVAVKVPPLAVLLALLG